MTIIEAYYKHGHGSNPPLVSTAEEMDALIDDLLSEPFDNSIAALYVQGRDNKLGLPDHELQVAVNAQDNVGALRYMGGSGTYFAKGTTSRYDEVAYYYMGNDHGFPRDSDLPLDAVRAAAKEFLASGGERPQRVQWRDATAQTTPGE